MSYAVQSNQSAIALERIFRAPPARVFKAWKNEAEFIRWFGATDSRPSMVQLDFRVGGSWRALFGPSDSPETYLTGEYLEIEENTKIVFTWNYVRCFPVAEAYRSPESIVSVTLEPQGSGTRLCFEQRGVVSEDARYNVRSGWNASLTLLHNLVVGGSD